MKINSTQEKLLSRLEIAYTKCLPFTNEEPDFEIITQDDGYIFKIDMFLYRTVVLKKWLVLHKEISEECDKIPEFHEAVENKIKELCKIIS